MGQFGDTLSDSTGGRFHYSAAEDLALDGLSLDFSTRLLGGIRIRVVTFTSLLSQRVFWGMPLPIAIDVQDLQVGLLFALASNESVGDSFQVTLRYQIMQPFSGGSGLAKASTTLTQTVTLASETGLAAGDLYAAQFSLDTQDAENPLVPGSAAAFEAEITDMSGISNLDLIGTLMEF